MNFRICLTDFIWYTIMYFLMLGLILVELCKVTPHEDGDSHHDDGVGIYTVLPHGVLTDIRQFFWRLSHFLVSVLRGLRAAVHATEPSNQAPDTRLDFPLSR